jgi:lipopolysaccharide assembly outer membrane protein LptD (OstA)
MKNCILLIGVLFGLSSFAQEKTVENKPSFTCDIVKFDSEKNTMEFNRNVSFKSDIIEIENADKIVMNKNTNEIIVIGLKDFTIDGAVQIKDKAEKKILKYTIGERIVYLE